MTDDSPIDNALPATTTRALKGVTTAPPFDRPLVNAHIERNGSRLRIAAQAIAWTRDAVLVRLGLEYGDQREVWLRAEDVTRR